jgi:hypothetical protein
VDGPEHLGRDLALLATTNPEAFRSALRELRGALAGAGHPDARLLTLGAELHALGEAVHAGPADAALDQADERLAVIEQLIAAAAPRRAPAPAWRSSSGWRGCGGSTTQPRAGTDRGRTATSVRGCCGG